MNSTKTIICVAFIWLSAGTTWGTIIRVPQDYATIQSAIEAASAGDTVLVSPGAYRENIDFNGKDIVVASLFLTTGNQQFINNTVIDADSGSVVAFANRETQNAVLCGLTITGGTGTSINDVRFKYGAGILIRSANPTIRSNLITRNATWPSCHGMGAGIAIMDSAHPLIASNTIIENDVFGPCAHLGYFGGGIWVDPTSNPIVGGRLENANDIYSNHAAYGEQLTCDNANIINAQFNYWGVCPPGYFDIWPKSTVDFSNCLSTPATKVDELDINLPAQLQLFQNYPNPFNPETTIEYALPKPGIAKLVIYDMLGQEVKVLVNEFQQAGAKFVVWDGKNNQDQPVPSGVYIYQLVTDGFTQSSKSVLLK